MITAQHASEAEAVARDMDARFEEDLSLLRTRHEFQRGREMEKLRIRFDQLTATVEVFHSLIDVFVRFFFVVVVFCVLHWPIHFSSLESRSSAPCMPPHATATQPPPSLSPLPTLPFRVQDHYAVQMAQMEETLQRHRRTRLAVLNAAAAEVDALTRRIFPEGCVPQLTILSGTSVPPVPSCQRQLLPTLA